MNRTAYTLVGFAFALTLALAPAGIAQQHQEHHPSGAPAAQDQPTMTAAEEQEQAPMMRPRRGMMGHGGMMLQQHLEWLSIIDQRAGGNIGARHSQPIKDNDKRYLFNSLMEEAIASSQLEGASTTREIATIIRTAP